MDYEAAETLVTEVSREMHWADYVVFSFFLLISAGIGIYFSFAKGGQKDTKEFLMGSRSLSLIPVTISILVSFTSAILILGAPAELYLNGAMYLLYPFGKILACSFAAIIFVPLFYPLKLTSSFEYLELRFRSKAVRLLGNFFYLLSAILYMGIAMFAPSAAMQKMTQQKFPVFGSIALCGAIGTFYTTLGGIKAVVWTDVFQAGVMLTGLIAIIVKGTVEVGGVDKVLELNLQYGRLDFGEKEWSFDPRVRHTVWGLVFGVAVGWLGTYGVNQASMQRYCALPSLRKARLSVLLNIPGAMILIWFTCAAGMVIFAVYASVQCDIHDIGWAGTKNDIVPYYVMDKLYYPAVPGIFLASLFSGALSSISSSLNACSAITWEDVLQPYVFPNVSERKAAFITKMLVLIYGILGTGFGFVASGLGGTVLQASLSFTAAVGAPSLGIFLMGALFPHANKWGAIFGGLVGLITNLWISIGAYYMGKQEVSLPGDISNCFPNSTLNSTIAPTTDFPPVSSALDDFYSISYMWYSALGVAVTIGVGLMVTGLTGPMKDIDARYVLPICHYFCCCCPRTCQTCINCGIAPGEREEGLYHDDNPTSMPQGIEMTNAAFNDASTSKETVVTKVEHEEEEYDQLEAF